MDDAMLRGHQRPDDVRINLPQERRLRHRFTFRSCQKYLCTLFNTNERTLYFSFGVVILVSFCISLYYCFSIKPETKRYGKPIMPPEICYSKPCNDSAEFLLKAMDRTVDPCQNFHEFVCGNYMVSKYDLVTKDIDIDMVDLMKSFDAFIDIEDSDYLTKLRKYYMSCVSKFLVYTNELKDKFDAVGGWPMANKHKLRFEPKLEWMKVFHKFYREGLYTDFLIGIEVRLHPTNIFKRIIMLKKPEPLRNIQKNFAFLRKNSIDIIIKLLNLQNVKKDFNDMIQFEKELNKISVDSKDEAFETIYKLQLTFPKIQWLQFLKGILPSNVKISPQDEVGYHMPFLKRFHDLMTSTMIPNHAIVNYFYWQNILNLEYSFLTNLNMTENYEMMKLNLRSQQIKTQREKDCTEKMHRDMQLAMSSIYVRAIFNHEKIEPVRYMSEKIRYRIYKNIQKVHWMNDKVKKKVMNKIARIKLLIAYPPEILNKTILNNYYKDLKLTSENFFINQMDFQRFKRKKSAQELTEPVDLSHWTGQIGSVTETRTVYMPQNVVIITGGMLHRLFFDLNIPNYMNYGMLGAIVGHEFAHAFGESNLFFDENNTFIRNEWDILSGLQLINKNTCFVKQYNKYRYTRHKFSVDGRGTLEENVADITGLKAAYDAYVSLTKDKPRESHFYGLEDFTANQMFWIAYGSMYCTEFGIEQMINAVEKEDEHAPEHFRVNGVVASLSEFAKDFKCKPGAPMNPTKRCPL